jgi:hypothetical protein
MTRTETNRTEDQTMRALPTALPLVALALTMIVAPVAGAGERVPRDAKQCISRHAIRGESAETHTQLIFHIGGGKAYRSYLPSPCDDILHVNNISKLRLHSADPDKLCAGDTVELADQDVLSAVIDSNVAGQKCRVGPFEAISEMSLSEELRR